MMRPLDLLFLLLLQVYKCTNDSSSESTHDVNYSFPAISRDGRVYGQWMTIPAILFPHGALVKFSKTGKLHEHLRPIRPFYCHGTIISDKFVLTTASCITKFLQGDVVELDYNDRIVLKPLAGFKVIFLTDHLNRAKSAHVSPITRIIHPIYYPQMTPYHNIALLELTKSLDFETRGLRHIALPGPEFRESFSGSKMYVAGFGLTDYSKINFTEPFGSFMLVQANVKSREFCNKLLKESGYNHNHMICVTSGEDEEEQGFLSFRDLGIGLFEITDNHQVVLHGVATNLLYRTADHQPDISTPSIFTRVSDHFYWITGAINSDWSTLKGRGSDVSMANFICPKK